MARTLVLLAHPDLRHSRVTRALMAAMQPMQGSDLAVRDLYALYPDYVIDVPAEQAELAQAELVVWLHPFHWYSMPSLMKLWLDEVLAYGDDRKRDMAGILERIGPFKWRLVIPWPQDGAKLQVFELTPVADQPE